MNIADITRQLLALDRKGGQKALAAKLEVEQPTVSRWLKGSEPKGPIRDRLLQLARDTGLLQDQPARAHRPPAKSRFHAVPLISWVSAGRLVEPNSQVPTEEAETLAIGDLVASGEYFALKVAGTSMNRISPDGSVIIVNRRERALQDGKAYVFSVRGEATYKLWRAHPPRLEPSSTDPSNEPIFIDKRNTLEIVGRVRRSIFDL